MSHLSDTYLFEDAPILTDALSLRVLCFFDFILLIFFGNVLLNISL